MAIAISRALTRPSFSRRAYRRSSFELMSPRIIRADIAVPPSHNHNICYSHASPNAIPLASQGSTQVGITRFFETVHHNQQGNRERLAEPYRLIQRVNECFVIIGKNLVDPKPLLAGLLFLRSQYAYKAAAGMALAGQVVEAFAMMRLCLEYAGYAITIFATAPSAQEIFLNRHVDDDSMKAQKEEFKISNIRATIDDFDPALSRMKAYPSASGDPICGGVAAPAGVERKANIVRSRDHHDRFSPLADRVPEPLSG